MKRIIVALLGLALVVSACAGETADNTANDGESFCPQIERKEVDFTVLNDLARMLSAQSIFHDTVSGDPDLIMKEALETLFSALGVRTADIPDWAKQMANEAVEEAGNRMPDFSVLNDIFDKLLDDPRFERFKEPSQLEQVLSDVIQGMIAALGDPFASYYDASTWLIVKDEHQGRSGEYRGVGIMGTFNTRGELEISGVVEGGPAERAGIKIGDAILEINGLSVAECSFRQFSARLKSLENPNLTTTLLRPTLDSFEKEKIEVSFTMEPLQQKHISSYPAVQLPDGRGSTLDGVPYRCGTQSTVGTPCPFVDVDGDGVSDQLYIKIAQFTDSARDDLEYVLEELDRQYGLDSFESVIIDVRDNPGGRVGATVDMVDFFLPDASPIFARVGRDNITVVTIQDKYNFISPDVPIVVLMNDQSASGSEVFAAALRDNGRAKIFNRFDRSQGKGTVNLWFELRGGEYGAVYVSIEYWKTPAGDMVEKMDLDDDGYYEVGGVKPDFEIAWSRDDISKNNLDVNYDPTLLGALEWLKQQLNK